MNDIYDPTKHAIIYKTNDKYGEFHCMCRGFPIVYGLDEQWPSAEALYQALKFPENHDAIKLIYNAHNGYVAKQIAYNYPEAHTQRPDLMKLVLDLKLRQHTHRLLPTLDEIYNNGMQLVEYSSKGDRFWGCSYNIHGMLEGQNMLGKLWREVYNEYKL